MRKATSRPGREPTGRDHYAELTEQIIAALEAGVPPWRKEWDPTKCGNPMLPENATTGARYRGINVLTFGLSPIACTSGDPRWATYKQAAGRGWQVRKGSRATTGFFYKRIEVHPNGEPGEDDGSGRWIPVLRAFSVFHASQIDGIPPYVPPAVEDVPWRPPEAAEAIARNSGAVIHVGGDRAFYSATTDHVQMPPLAAFRSPEAWASVQLHELAHWSGAPTRLKRDLGSGFGSEAYAREELRAELAQMMLCAELKITDCEWTNGLAYLGSWLERLRSDKKEIFRAASDGQRIADYLLAFHPAYGRRGDDTGSDAEFASEPALAEAA